MCRGEWPSYALVVTNHVGDDYFRMLLLAVSGAILAMRY